MSQPLDINVNSEVGKLEGVILHRPGPEIENMIPENAERALYSDILNLSVAAKEYDHLFNTLSKVTNVFTVTQLLSEILENEKVKQTLLRKICSNEKVYELEEKLYATDANQLASMLIHGIVMDKKTLTSYFSKERYSLRPLHNFFFTRDASMSLFDTVLIGKMASQVRERESLIMEAIFDYHPHLKTKAISPYNSITDFETVTIEGGDLLVAREDTILIGTGVRTTPQGIDFIVDKYATKGDMEKKHILIQELPPSPESFIHLDMVFTFLDTDSCMVYDPVILNQYKLQTVHILIENGEVTKIFEEDNLLKALSSLGFDLKPAFCGGHHDEWIQKREQWHSGANFFAIAPGKVLGYERNVYTMEELSRHGYEILKARQVINGKVSIDDYKKCVITIPGSELSRGGGGCRCMTMPLHRQPVSW